jgi:hypothetical protein
MVFASVAAALYNALIGRKLAVVYVWLHDPPGISVNNILMILSVVCWFKTNDRGLIQGKNPVETVLSLSKIIIDKAASPGWEIN